MKEISYRGGLLTFSIPFSWKEEYENEGGATFYEDIDDSGTLRLNVMTFSSSDESKTIDLEAEAQRDATEHGGFAKLLDDGNALVRYDKGATEDGVPIMLRYWHVYNCVPPKHTRIAVFSYTLLKTQVELPKYINELEMLNQEISRVKFSRVLGERT